jgi:hypothetical protein
LKITRTRPKGLQTLLSARIAADIKLVCIEYRLKLGNLRFGRNLPRFLDVSEQTLAYQGREQRNDDHDDEQLDKSDAAISSFRVH